MFFELWRRETSSRVHNLGRFWACEGEMTCSPHTVPYSIWRLGVFRDLFLSRSHAQLSQKGQQRCLSSARKLRANYANKANNEDASSSAKSTDSNVEHATKTRPSDSLPRSPLFAMAQCRQMGSRTRKPKGTKADDARLQNNPWAMALASPIRHCRMTGARLPKAFLTDMGLIKRITPAQENNMNPRKATPLWWMPTGLLNDELKAIADLSKNNADAAPMMPSNYNSAVMRMLSRSLLFEYVTPSGGDKVKPGRFIPVNWRVSHNKLSDPEIKAVTWRPDMFKFVLKYMRRNVVKALKEAYRYENIKRDTADQWRALQLSELSVTGLVEGLRRIEMTDMKTGAVVIVGDPEDTETKTPFVSSFPDYVTLPQTRSAVPVYDLSTLLSASVRDALRQCIPRFNEKALFFRPDGPKSVDAMLAMWELKGFVMHDTAFFSESLQLKSP
ncbi:hypothetical protein UA08_06767 [Talaromyces atroroseus]|uniref:Uncharacterized protein n=1 Tax=Talaromyces atroroseus TaxID=1441469 RepID=A0A225ARJ4_TALAT|nr:hypothetical protein UA08_06767 [Talaromyces atroroseus]OKL58199.1 hypothetical protein UA08_06767 [Talaromyces atroroseus]